MMMTPVRAVRVRRRYWSTRLPAPPRRPTQASHRQPTRCLSPTAKIRRPIRRW
jgi:hypothetical protein